jgi:hypothetical protein
MSDEEVVFCMLTQCQLSHHNTYCHANEISGCIPVGKIAFIWALSDST